MGDTSIFSLELHQGWVHDLEWVEKSQFPVLIRTETPAFFMKNASGCIWTSSSRRTEKQHQVTWLFTKIATLVKPALIILSKEISHRPTSMGVSLQSSIFKPQNQKAWFFFLCSERSWNMHRHPHITSQLQAAAVWLHLDHLCYILYLSARTLKWDVMERHLNHQVLMDTKRSSVKEWAQCDCQKNSLYIAIPLSQLWSGSLVLLVYIFLWTRL